MFHVYLFMAKRPVVRAVCSWLVHGTLKCESVFQIIATFLVSEFVFSRLETLEMERLSMNHVHGVECVAFLGVNAECTGYSV